jgi:sugar phosphate isomerase/epimerase
MADLARLSLNTVTVRDRWTLGECIEGCARHRIPGIGVWRDKLADHGVATAVRHIRDAGLRVSSLCRGGLFTAGERQAAIDENFRAIDEAAALGADCLVVVAGGLPEASKDLVAARAIVADGLARILPHARAAGVMLALEPLHPMTCADRAVLCSLAHALDLADTLGDGIGVTLDVYHLWWDHALQANIARARGRIAAFHVCDWRVPTRDTAFDRAMMGDGVIDIPPIRRSVDGAGYDGMIEVEILSTDWWRRDPDEVLRVVKQRFATAV